MLDNYKIYQACDLKVRLVENEGRDHIQRVLCLQPFSSENFCWEFEIFNDICHERNRQFFSLYIEDKLVFVNLHQKYLNGKIIFSPVHVILVFLSDGKVHFT
jgi:hypothetical protein